MSEEEEGKDTTDQVAHTHLGPVMSLPVNGSGVEDSGVTERPR